MSVRVLCTLYVSYAAKCEINNDDDSRMSYATIRSVVATSWTGVHVSIPILPAVVPEIGANPMSFYGEEGRGLCHVRSLTRQFAPDPLTTRSAPGPIWGLCPQTPVIGSRFALAMSVHSTVFDLVTPLSIQSNVIAPFTTVRCNCPFPLFP